MTDSASNPPNNPPAPEFSPLPAGTPPQITTMECGAAISRGEMERFVRSFQQSTRRWELIVYPAMFAFVVLAGYGFFLIYSLTRDIAIIARSMDHQMGSHMESMSEDIGTMAGNIRSLTEQIQAMRKSIDNIADKIESVPPMLTRLNNMDISIAHMDQSIRMMSITIDQIRMDVGTMNRNISRPLSFFNKAAPW